MEQPSLINSLAHICLKEMGAVGPEAAAMAAKIKSEWKPRADAFVSDMLSLAFDFETGLIDSKVTKEVFDKHEPEMSDGFVKAVGNTVADYSVLAFEEGLSRAYYQYRGAKVEKYSVLERLSQVTGSTKANVGRTVNRWFETTQGRYFTRFILPYTERMTLERMAEGRKPTLNVIGRRYKEFVDGGGYWDSITDYDAATSNIFAQIEAYHALGFQGVRIEAQLDRNCCPVCQAMDGTTWPLFEARAQMFDMLMMTAEEAVDEFPWPRMDDVKGAQPNRIPPYHLRCRCHAQPVTLQRGNKLIPKDIRGMKMRVAGLLGASNTRVEKYVDGCITKAEKGMDADCVTRNLSSLQQAQSSYEGSLLAAGLIGWGLLKFLDRSKPVDYVTDKSAFDVHVLPKDGEYRRSASQSRTISEFSTGSSLNPWTIVLSEGEPMAYDVYLSDGFDFYSLEDMEYLGMAYREDGSDVIEEDMLDKFHSLIGE